MSINETNGREIAFYGPSKNKKIIHIKEDDGGQKLITGDNMFIYPDKNARQCIYVAGQSGSGKSVWARRYCLNFMAVHPDKEIYLFTPVNETLDAHDDFEGVRLNRINMFEFLEQSIMIEEFPDGCLIVFDDCDTYNNKAMLKKISDLQYKILEVGRHKNIYVVILSHLLIRDTRGDNARMYNECHLLTIFPRNGNARHMKHVLSNYFNLDLNIVKILLEIDSRWITVCRQYPKYVIYDKGVMVLE